MQLKKSEIKGLMIELLAVLILIALFYVMTFLIMM